MWCLKLIEKKEKIATLIKFLGLQIFEIIMEEKKRWRMYLVSLLMLLMLLLIFYEDFKFCTMCTILDKILVPTLL